MTGKGGLDTLKGNVTERVGSMDRKQAILTALGQSQPDLVLKNAKIIDVLGGGVYEGDVAIRDGFIAGIGSYDAPQAVDLQGRYLAPGFINAHCHVESTMVLPEVYCREELRWGVTTVITDPHEIANVAGEDGIRFMLEASKGLPVNYYIQAPSCVPATPFEHAGAVLTAEKLEGFLHTPRVLGLGEMMNYPGVAGCDPEVLDKLERFSGTVIDGHAPGISGNGLQAYAAAGILTDHESICYAEALEKLRAGIAVLVREGSASKNLKDILAGVLRDRICTQNMAFCTDDKHLADVRREGTIRYNIKLAVELGMDPVEAIRMATINAARIYRLERLGAVAVGYRADLAVLDDLEGFTVHAVYKDGNPVDLDAPGLIPQKPVPDSRIFSSVNPARLDMDAFLLPQREVYPVIRLLPGQIVTQKGAVQASELAEALTSGKLRKIAVIERHHATGQIGVGLIEGYGLRHGAIGTTVAHDSHNMIVVGDNDADMLAAANELVRVQGGYTAVQDGTVLGTLPLPVAGLMSDQPAESFLASFQKVEAAARKMEVCEGIDPFTTLSFIALPVIPEIRLTDMGMFDVTTFSFF